MSLRAKLLSASGGVDKLYVDDVFSAYTYTGTGATQTITNGIDLAGKGGLVWIKNRSNPGTLAHELFDTNRGALNQLISSSSAAQSSLASSLTGFSSNGFALGAEGNVNGGTSTFASWTFRKAPKFFDVVTYTGNAGTKAVPHSLGSAPAMIIVKKTNVSGTASDWVVYHQAVPANCGFLNATSSFASAQRFSSVTASDFTINVSTADVNENSSTYVAYLFAHDTSADGIIQCGSFTVSSGTGTTEVNLGWEPQFLLTKYNLVGYDWNTYDASRGWTATTTGGNVNVRLSPNSSGAEATDRAFQPTATGFRMDNSVVYPSTPVTVIYLAIRRPNKPPTSGTQVYNAIARTGTGAAAKVTGVGFAPDLDIVGMRGASPMYQGYVFDRLRGMPSGGNLLSISATSAEQGYGGTITSLDMNGATYGTDPSGVGVNVSGAASVNWFFKRAPGVFDVVCYTGTGAARTVDHGLGVVPELVITKSRSTAYSPAWGVYHAALGNTKYLNLEATVSEDVNSAYWNNTTPTTSVFTVASNGAVNANTATYVAYLFATKAGISKVFNYTGNGGSQTINCGFTTGTRFILIKRTDSTGNWYVWDTVRGIIAGNDPHLSLNTTAAEVTTNDSIDPDSSGFIVNQVTATNINVTSATYIGLALA